MFTENDKKQIVEHGLTVQKVQDQLSRFSEGFPPMKLVRAAVPDDGIIVLSKDDQNQFVDFYDRNMGELKVVKFVPASGAASRMFKALFAFRDTYLGTDHQEEALTEDEKIKSFIENRKKFAFYGELHAVALRLNQDIEELTAEGKYAEVIDLLLSEKGLNYGNLPKGLLAFHRYEDGSTRLPIEEHLIEAAEYASDQNHVARVHFTVSPEHLGFFRDNMAAIIPRYEEQFKVKYEISYSTQKSSTDTIAANDEGDAFRENNNSLLFRPAGHGALIENLNDVKGDILFIKNIDNVVPDKWKRPTIHSKKLLGGILLRLRAEISDLYDALSKDQVELSEVLEFFKHRLNVELGNDLSKQDLLNKLNRPLRVCGMVINKGEAGGGPFWCRNSDGSVSLQIVESSQFDSNSQTQMDIVQHATHFNPVDVVVFKTDIHGQPINLLHHVDHETGFISDKSKDGRTLKAMELPGLWNGSMSDWNTLFVEVPENTFSPVKEVTDLLRDLHQG